MHQGLDLSRFKKVSSDKKTTTLRHAKGHEIKIAHSGLTPKMRESLDKLEQHEEVGAVKRYAEGTPEGVVAQDDEPQAEVPLDPASPAPVAAVPAPAPQAPDTLAASTVTPEEGTPEAPTAQAVPKPAVMPQAGTVDIVAPPKTPQMVAQDMTQHDLDFQKDMQMGHVKPETYQSLYAKKDTLGKIGTLFGLLVSGAGAGLTHQPNAVLEMMNKEIQNDFEAQQKTQGNAQNWYTATKNHDLQKAQMEQMGVQNLQTLTNVSKAPYEIKQLEAQTKASEADTALKWSAQAINRMKIGAVQNLQDQANKLPPGPQKEAYQNGVNLLSSAVQQDIGKTNLETADKIAARDKLRESAAPKANDPGVDMDKFNKLIAQSRANQNLGIEGMMNEGDISKASQEATQVADNRVTAKIYDDSYKKLDKAFAAGSLNPQLRAALLSTLGTEIARATAGRYNAAEAQAQADGMFPSVKDWGSSRAEKYRKSMEYFEGQEAGTTTLNRLGLKKPFPYAMRSPKEKGSKGAQGNWGDDQASKVAGASGPKYREGDKKNGFVVQGGKWVPDSATKQATK